MFEFNTEKMSQFSPKPDGEALKVKSGQFTEDLVNTYAPVIVCIYTYHKFEFIIVILPLVS